MTIRIFRTEVDGDDPHEMEKEALRRAEECYGAGYTFTIYDSTIQDRQNTPRLTRPRRYRVDVEPQSPYQAQVAVKVEETEIPRER